MEKVFKNNNDGTLSVTCTYQKEEYAPIASKVQINLCKNVTVKGFRKGKAPIETAIRYIKPEDVYNGMINKLIDKDFASLLDGYDASTVANIHPSLKVDYDDKKKEYKLAYTFYLLPTSEVKKSTDLKVKATKKKVTDEEINSKIDALLVDNAELVPSEDKASENGDHVIIDFTGYVDGKEFDGGSANDYELVLGSNSFVPGFESQLIGMKEDEKRTIEVTFPENYVASLAGKKAKFSVKCKAVKKVVKPELNDDFATSLDSYKVKTVEELKAKIKEDLGKQHEQEARDEKLNKVLQAIAKDTKAIYSQHYLDVMSKQIQNNQVNQIKQYGLDLDSYLKLIGLSKEQFETNCKNQAVQEANSFAILQGVAKANKLEVSQEELENYFGGKEKFDQLMDTAKKQQGKNPNFSIEAYLDNVKQSLLDQKVKNFLIDNN